MMLSARTDSGTTICDELLDRFAASTLTLLAVESYVNESNIAALLRGGLHNVILLCVDNHATRKLVNDHCATLPDVCLISGGNDPAGSATVPDQREQVVGQAVIVAMGETTSDLRPEWSADRGGGEIWVRQAF
jgi:hypothetical protein